MKSILSKAPMWAAVLLAAGLAGCQGGIKDTPEDMNVSPRSQEAYDPVYRDLENDPANPKKQQQ